MSKFTKEFELLKGKQVNFMGYRQTGVWGMYCENVRHHWFGIYGIIGFRYSVKWGSSW